MMRSTFLVAAALLLASAAGAATVKRLTLGQLADSSELVFVGTVKDQRSTLEQNPTRVWTTTVFDVEQTLKGDKTSGPFVLRQLGGVVGEIRQEVYGYPTFAVGERVLLFLERAQSGRLVVTGLAQGKYTLTTDAKTGEVVADRSLDELAFLGERPRTLAGAPDPNHLRLKDLARIVAGERALKPVRLLETPQRVTTRPEVSR